MSWCRCCLATLLSLSSAIIFSMFLLCSAIWRTLKQLPDIVMHHFGAENRQFASLPQRQALKDGLSTLKSGKMGWSKKLLSEAAASVASKALAWACRCPARSAFFIMSGAPGFGPDWPEHDPLDSC